VNGRKDAMAYEVIIDNVNQAEWEQSAKGFADYSIYQTWAYQNVRAEMAGQELSRAVIRDHDNNVVTMCHVRIQNVKSLGLKIGYVQKGPLMLARDGRITCSAEALSALREAYMGGRVSVLRVAPNLCDDRTGRSVSQMLTSGGYQIVGSVLPYRTLMLDLRGSEEDIRRGLDRNFRRNLKKAEQAGIDVQEGSDGPFCEILRELYLSMVERKGFKALDVDEFIKPQSELSAVEKMNFVVAYCDGSPVSVHLASHLGTTGVALLVASNEKGLSCRSSYLIWWKACLAAKHAGMKQYDLGGIDPQSNPGGYQFKSQISRCDSLGIGAFDACSSVLVRNVWRASEKVYHFIKR
jgi:lipid II:glycine glycyltransferase (peptidoglycan interpeptide bridge formation enzyme)